jgi:O-acetylhomoserine (thiol)-lyase
MSTPKFETNALHAGHDTTKHGGTRAVPIYQTSSYVSITLSMRPIIWSIWSRLYLHRLNNPTNDILEQRLAALEEVAAVVTASGTAAMLHLNSFLLKTGDHIGF